MPTKVKTTLGKWSRKQFVLPDYDGHMEHTKGESLMLFGWQEFNGKKFRPFYGIGIVYRVVKGEKSDLVYVNFGTFPDNPLRLVVVIENRARRQTLTLKRGQVCQVYGFCRFYTQKVMDNGVEKKLIKLALFAKGLQGWYTPTALDIKRTPINEDIDEPTEKEETLEERMENILDQFINGEIE